MKSICFLALAGLVAANAIERRATCNADNCLRALTGTGSNAGTARPAVAKADCSSYFSTVVTSTITPSTITVFPTVSVTTSTTVTGTNTVLVTITNTEVDTTTTIINTISDTTAITDLAKRATASNIPSYASACSGSVRYSSACSCLGVTATTSTLMITLPTPTATMSVTVIDVLTAMATSSTTVLNTVTTTTRTTESDTATAEATVTCSVGAQIVYNPSFEQYNFLSPVGWSQQSSQLDALINSPFCAEDGNKCEYFVGDNGPVSGSVSQTLTAACPGATYTFSAYVGFYDSGATAPFGTYITVTLDGVTIVPRQLTCSGANPCNINPNAEDAVYYREILETVTVTTFNPVLVVLLDSPANSQEIYDTALDNVRLVEV